MATQSQNRLEIFMLICEVFRFLGLSWHERKITKQLLINCPALRSAVAGIGTEMCQQPGSWHETRLVYSN